MAFANPLSKTQKAALSELARKGFDHMEELGLVDTIGKTKSERFTKWRRAQQVEAVGKASLTHCNQNDYLDLRAHFNSILGRDDKAFNDHMRSLPVTGSSPAEDTQERRTQLKHNIDAHPRQGQPWSLVPNKTTIRFKATGRYRITCKARCSHAGSVAIDCTMLSDM